ASQLSTRTSIGRRVRGPQQAIMPALVGTVMSRSPSGNVPLRDGDGVLGTQTTTSPTKLWKVGAASTGETRPGDRPASTVRWGREASTDHSHEDGEGAVDAVLFTLQDPQPNASPA